MKVWITKYALTSGITEHDSESFWCDMVKYGAMYYAHGKYWHGSYIGALMRAEEMRIAKRASLKKSIARLEAMRFDV